MMLWLPIAFVTLMALAVMTVFLLTFCNVAFAEASCGVRRFSTGLDVPSESNDRMHAWAANLARRVVARHAQQPRSAETPLAIASELEASANAVLERAAQQASSSVKSFCTIATTCPNPRPRQIAVTAPEVFAITTELERTYSNCDLQIVRELAVLNGRRARFVLPEEFPQAGITCPLRAPDGHCMTFTNRPIACRQLSDSCPCGDSGSCQGGSCKSSCSPTDVAEQLHDGISNGLSEGLRLAGLDDGAYELNDALATALTTPHAAARWSQGEAVFANCAKA